MKKQKGTSLDEVLAKELKNDEFRLAYEERKFYLQVARLIAKIREKAGLSQAELAKLAKVSQPLIARLEKGDQQRVPTFETLFKILKAMGYRLDIKVHPEKQAA